MARAPKKPAALKIAGNTLEEFLPLLPAEEAFRQCAAAGEVFEPEDYEGRQPEKTTMKNTIRAEFLRYMILGGCERSPVHPSGIGIEGCLIDCSKETGLFLVSTTIPNVLRFTNCNFCDGPINLNHALSNGIFFERCKIYSFHADGLNVGGALHFSNGTQITGRASLVGSKIGVELSCRRGVFHLGLDAQNVTNTTKVNDYAKMMAISAKTLNSISKSIVHKAAKEFIDEICIKQIKRLLINTPLSIKEIAYESGFEETTNFYKYFKRQVQMTPEQFRTAN